MHAAITAAQIATRAAAQAGEVAVTLSGDGLIGAVAGALSGIDDALIGVLPGGRGNDFARKLGIPADPEGACDVLVHGTERAVDVADVGGRTYLGIASAGLDSDVQDIANATRLPLGYLYGTLRALRSWRPARWLVSVDGDSRSYVGYSVAVANSGVFGGGMRLVPDADLADGELDVVLTMDTPRRTFVRNLPRVFSGTHVDQPSLVFLRGRTVTLWADRPFVAYADGDPIAELPATVRVRPGALRVIAPR